MFSPKHSENLNRNFHVFILFLSYLLRELSILFDLIDLNYLKQLNHLEGALYAFLKLVTICVSFILIPTIK